MTFVVSGLPYLRWPLCRTFETFAVPVRMAAIASERFRISYRKRIREYDNMPIPDWIRSLLSRPSPEPVGKGTETIRDRAGRTELMNAVIDGDDARVRMLLDAGAEPDDVDKAGWCALHFAAQECSETMVRMLVNAGTNLELRENYGNTPLMRAVSNYRGGAEVISTLLEAGANPDAENNSGISPRASANTIANYDTAKFF